MTKIVVMPLQNSSHYNRLGIPKIKTVLPLGHHPTTSVIMLIFLRCIIVHQHNGYNNISNEKEKCRKNVDFYAKCTKTIPVLSSVCYSSWITKFGCYPEYSSVWKQTMDSLKPVMTKNCLLSPLSFIILLGIYPPFKTLHVINEKKTITNRQPSQN